MAGTATPATTAATKAGIDFRVHTYDHDPRAQDYGAEAVRILTERLAVEPEQILKTLVLALPDRSLMVAVLPVPATLTLKAAAAAVGARKATLADHAAAERATGYVLGGISPLGQRTRLRTVVDESATRWPTVLCSAGRRGLEIELAPDDLIRLASAVVAPVAG